MNEEAGRCVIAVLRVTSGRIEQTTIAQLARPGRHHRPDMGQPLERVEGINLQCAVEENFSPVEERDQGVLESCVNNFPKLGSRLQWPLAPGNGRRPTRQINSERKHTGAHVGRRGGQDVAALLGVTADQQNEASL